MKLLILFVALAWANAAKLDKTYLPPRTAPTSGGSGTFLQTPFSGATEFQGSNGVTSGDLPQGGNTFSQNVNNFNQPRIDQYSNVNANTFEARPERAQAAFERNAAILRQDNQNDGETYAYAYETENGIVAEENGVATNGVEAQGGFSYTGDDGQVYTIRYTADQNGFVPQGDHLPTPPPVPEEILRALEQNARDEAAGIYDDGSYNEAKYGSGDEYRSNNAYNNYNNNAFANQSERQDDEDSVVTNSAVFRNQGSFNNGAANQAGANTQAFVGRQADANKAYLPPFASQKSFGSRSRPQSFNARTGYRY